MVYFYFSNSSWKVEPQVPSRLVKVSFRKWPLWVSIISEMKSLEDAYDLMKTRFLSGYRCLNLLAMVQENFHAASRHFSKPWRFELFHWCQTGAQNPWDIGKIADVETLWTSWKDSWNRPNSLVCTHQTRQKKCKSSRFSVQSWPFVPLWFKWVSTLMACVHEISAVL